MSPRAELVKQISQPVVFSRRWPTVPVVTPEGSVWRLIRPGAHAENADTQTPGTFRSVKRGLRGCITR
jgi:hypothetical protein